MSPSLPSLFDGPLHDAATCCARDIAAASPDPMSNTSGLQHLASLGWPGVLISERHGGAEGTLADLGALVEPLAAAAVSLPVVEACAVAPLLLIAADDSTAAAGLLDAMAQGRARVLPLLDLCAPLGSSALRAERRADGLGLSGSVRGVAFDEATTHWLALAQAPNGGPGDWGLYALDSAALRPATVFRTMAGARTADFQVESLPVTDEALVARGQGLSDALALATLAGQWASCVEIAAACSALIDQTLAHLKNRRQFDVPLSSFQVLRHRVVDMYVRCVSGRNLIAQVLREPGENLAAAQRRMHLLKLSLGEIGRFCAEQAIQSHGALGISEEVLAARLAQRLLQADFRFGDRWACLHALKAADTPAATAAAQQPLPHLLRASASAST